MVAAIEERKDNDDLRTRVYTEWQTRTICQFVAATVPTAKGKANKLLDQAMEVSLMTTTEKDELRSATPIARDDVPFDPEDHEAAVLRAASGNKEGSFEKVSRGLIPKDRV